MHEYQGVKRRMFAHWAAYWSDEEFCLELNEQVKLLVPEITDRFGGVLIIDIPTGDNDVLPIEGYK
jgi:hypothetical protein